MNPLPPRLLVTIDTECDKSSTWRTASPLTFRGVTEAIPGRLQPLFARYGIRPTYLLSPEVMTHPESVAVLRELRDVELSTHLHGDYIVPGIKTWDFAGSLTDEMQWEYGEALERAKMGSLTELFRQQFGRVPRSFRAGRFGAGPHTGKILQELGYRIDSSVTPHVCWTSRQGLKRPDYRGSLEFPYTLGPEGDIARPGVGGLLELPVTLLPAGTVPSSNPAEPIWFRPWYSDAETLCRVVDWVLSQPPVGGVCRPLVMMFHNVEVVAGASPYPQSEAEVRHYLDLLEAVFEHAARHRVTPCTLAEYADHFMNHWRVREPVALPAGQSSSALEIQSAAAPGPDLRPEIHLSAALVEATLTRHGVQPWFNYIFRERATRWDVVWPCQWIARNVAPTAPILSIGTGVGFNLFWLAEHAFTALYGTDIDPKAVAAGIDLARQSGLPVTLVEDNALDPRALGSDQFAVIEALNWCHLLEDFSLDRLLELYVPHLAAGGVFIIDTIDAAYNQVPGNQYHTADREKPEAERRPSEYKSRFSEADIRAAFARHGLEIVERLTEPQQIPKRVYIGRLTAAVGNRRAADLPTPSPLRLAASSAAASGPSPCPPVPARTGGDPREEAEHLIRAALRENPNGVDALKLLVSICLDSSRWVEAAQACYRILQQTPDDREVLQALAHCLEATGETDTAVVVRQRLEALHAGQEGHTPRCAPESAAARVSSAPVHGSVNGRRPRVLLIADVPDWIFDRHCQHLGRALRDEFECAIQYQGQPLREGDFDLIFPLEWNLVPSDQITQPAKWITGIRSHTSWKDWDFLQLAAVLAAKFQHVTVVSQRLFRLFQPFLPSVSVLSHGVDTEFFRPTTRADQSGPRLRLGWAGNRVNPTKGFEQYIAPLGRLPGVELVFCGYQDRHLSMDEMRGFYNALDAYVCSSAQEGNNNSLLEAAAMERAIITTDNGTVPEYLRDGESALVVDRDPPALIQAVVRLRDDPSLRLALGARARRAVERTFAWRDLTPRYRRMLWEALDNRGRHQPDADAPARFIRPRAHRDHSQPLIRSSGPAPGNRPPAPTPSRTSEAPLPFDPSADPKRALADHVRARRWVEAGRVAVRLLEQDPDDVSVLLLLARSLAEAGDRETATEVYRRVMALDPDNFLAGEFVGEGGATAAPATAPAPAPATPVPAASTPASETTALAAAETGYSFCLITDGRRPAKLRREIESIRALAIPAHEILVGGDIPDGFEDVVQVSLPDAARNGRLGEMRNALVRRARFDHLVVADDDMVFHADYYQGLLHFGEDYDVLCVRLLNPDGSRFWDWATHGGPRGHCLLDYAETDAFVYPTGGLCLLKVSVARNVHWDDVRGFYAGEDLDFAERLRQAGYRVRFNPHSTVTHDDLRYTQVGDGVLRVDHVVSQAKGAYADRNAVRAADLLRRVPALAGEERGRVAEALTLARQHNDEATVCQLLEAARRRWPDDTAWAAFDVRLNSPAVRPASSRIEIPVRWLGPIFNPSGYASEAINFLVPLAHELDLGIQHANNLHSETFVAGLEAAERDTLLALRDRFDTLRGGIAIYHNPAHGFVKCPGALYHIGRTMYETDRIPKGWAERCNAMDEVWVPSQFNVETFAAAGVERHKLVVIPGAVNAREFDPARHTPLPLPNPARYNLLAIFEWSKRKAWDVLLSAYLREFSAYDDVCLYLRTYLFSRPDGDPAPEIWRRIREFAETLDLGSKPWPRIELLADQVAQADLPRLYKAVDCLVGVSRGEGWGRPQHEAMMMGLPVIATRWSANTEFMTSENSFLLDYTLVDTGDLEPELAHYRGHRWAEPDGEQLRRTLRHLRQHPEAGRAVGARAREHVLEHFSREPVARRVLERLRDIEDRCSRPYCPPAPGRVITPAPQTAPSATVRVAWEGAFLDLGSLAQVNRQLTETLRMQPGVELTCVGRNVLRPEHARLPELQATAKRLKPNAGPRTQITIRHDWPPRWDRPEHGALVIVQPWEYGSLPQAWVHRAPLVDEFWVYTEHVRQVYLQSGIPTAKVRVVPCGVNPERFKPGVAPMSLATRKRFKFLFVGGTIHRKGPDVLLEAYTKAFTAADDVCLVIKDFGGQDVYAGQTLEARIRALQAQPGAPEILYLTEALPAESMPGLYAACDCLVHPYRGEGFGLPVLEAMACGLPVIVTGGGATDDFATEALAYRLPATRQLVGRNVGGLPLVHDGWVLEPDPTALATRMRWVWEHPDEARTRGQQSSEHARTHWTWKAAARIARDRIVDLASRLELATQREEEGQRRRESRQLELPAAARLGCLTGARDHLQQRQWSEAWTRTLAAMEVRPFHPEAYLLLAEIAQSAGDPRLARACARHAQTLAPGWKAPRKFLKSVRGETAVSPSPAWMTVPPGLEGSPAANPAAEAGPTGRAEPRLSVCLITKNEEAFLARCLESVKALAWQIVVVDTGSTDRTVAIARELGAEVATFPWCDDFSTARNAALERARGDWVLMLDADEELSADSRDALRSSLTDPTVMAWRLRLQDVANQSRGWSYVPRLFRNAPALFYLGRVHEQVFSSIEVRRREWGLENRLGTALLRHHGYSPELMRTRGKVARNLRLLELALEELPNDPGLRMNYGLELCRSGRSEEALEQYLAALKCIAGLTPDQVVPEQRETLLTQTAAHLIRLKLFSEVEVLFESPVARAHGPTASHEFLWGLACQQLEKFKEAAAHFSRCLEIRSQPALEPGVEEIHGGAPHHCLAMCRIALKDDAGAAQSFAAALAEDPEARPIRFDHARFLMHQGQPLPALETLHRLVTEKADDPMPWEFGARIALSRPEFLEFARDWTSEAVKAHPRNNALWRQRAEVLLLSGMVDEASTAWITAGYDPGPRAAVGSLICQLVLGRPPTLPHDLKPQIAHDEFVNWYRQLVRWQAGEVVRRVNDQLDALATVLPRTARLLREVVDQAAAAA